MRILVALNINRELIMQRLAATTTMLIVVLTACAPHSPVPPTHDRAADVAAIDALRNKEIVSLAALNMDTLMTVYSSDAVIMPPGGPMLTGTAAIRTWATESFKDVTIQGQYTSSQVEVIGDWAIDRYTGALTITPKGGQPMSEVIKGIHVLKRQPNGGWLIVQDVWNADPPAAAAGATPGKAGGE
jgi:ketosteroid isomerase-like protein